MSMTLEEVTTLFQEYCEKHRKLFLPGPNDGPVVKSLVDFYSKHYSIEILCESIEYYIKQSKEPVQIYNFAVESSQIRDHVVAEKRRREDFDKLLHQTQERMNQINRKD